MRPVDGKATRLFVILFVIVFVATIVSNVVFGLFKRVRVEADARDARQNRAYKRNEDFKGRKQLYG